VKRIIPECEKQNIFEMNQEIIGGILQSKSSRFNHLKTERFDPESLWNRVDGDMGLLRELVEVFAEEGPRMLARIDDAIRHGSARELEKASHKMKGSALQFSASAAASVAFELEEKGKCGLVTGAEQLSYQLKQEVELLQKSLNAMAYSDTAQ